MLQKIPACVDAVMVVDNNSTDDTLKVANKYGWAKSPEEKRFFFYIRQVIKRGYGVAYKYAFNELMMGDVDIIVAMDADDSYPLDEVERCVRFLLDNGLDFVSCSRFPLKDKKSMTPINYVGNRFLTMVANELFGLELHDITTGMWVMRHWILPACLYYSDGMQFTIEWKLWGAVFSDFCRFGETHISYHPRIGEVKQKWLRDGFKYLWTLIKMRCER